MYLDLHIGYQLMIEKESVFNLHAKKCLSSIPLSNVSLPIKNDMFLCPPVYLHLSFEISSVTRFFLGISKFQV